MTMNALIEDIVARKPHLADPFRFYGKALRFNSDIQDLKLPYRPDLHAYPSEYAARIMERFAAALELPAGNLSPLQQALEVGDLDFTRLPLREVPSFSLPYAEDDLTILLFLMSRPYFLGLREKGRIDNLTWDDGKCPLCSGQPSLSSRDGERLRLHCSFCGSTGRFPAGHCPLCLTTEPKNLQSLTFAGEEDYSIQTCDACRTYLKITASSRAASLPPDLADLESLPLDIVLQQKGYSRRSPNPIGMLRMAVSG